MAMKKVLIFLDSDSLGDTIACIPYVNKFFEDNECEVYLSIEEHFIFLFESSYTNINYLSRSYDLNFDEVITLIPSFTKNLQLGYAEQLGYVSGEYIKPKLNFELKDRPIKNKYVTMSVHSTIQMKYWNHPLGNQVQGLQPYWNDLSSMIRKKGMTPVVIDKNELFGDSENFNGIPKKCQNKTGMSLYDTINFIQHSEFFIGLSSGLSWLAHALGKKVVMISNFTESWYEFDLNDNDYIRITNNNVCNGCFNKIGVDYEIDVWDWYWCPKHKGTERQFECHKSITPQMVMEQINKWL